ncbi:MAG: YwaF family protein [Clostridia bacterium]|nr:YwaF family protein [Clostridia bacterium]MBQ8792031.1 YwaF family protein [Clostridia bacterium]
MNFLEQIITALSGTMPTPQNYGWFHLMFIGITIVGCIVAGILLRKASDKTIRIFLMITSIILIVLEIYKQLLYSYNPKTDTWDYQWYIFPFQFCSSPMYVSLIASFCRKCKFRDFLYSFLSTYCLLAGFIVMIMPDVFTSKIGNNIQTMVHHGSMIMIGIVMLTSKSVEFKHKTILKALSVFAVLVSIALLFDCVYIWAGGTETCNLFFISPYGQNHFPVFSDIQNVSYPLFLFCYVFAFSLAAYIILLIAMGIDKLIQIYKAKKQPAEVKEA